MAEHIDELRKHVANWKGLEGLANAIDNGNPEEKTGARRKLLERVAGKTGSSIEDIIANGRDRDNYLMNDAVADYAESRNDAGKYLVDNQDKILAEVSDEIKREAIYDALPSLGAKPNPKDEGEFGKISKKHSKYLELREQIVRVQEGKTKQGDKKKLFSLAAREYADEVVKDIKDKGLREYKEMAAIQNFMMGRKRELVMHYATQRLEKLRKDMEESFSKSYEATQYADDLLKGMINKNKENAAYAIASLKEK